MSLKAGRVGVDPSQVDSLGIIKGGLPEVTSTDKDKYLHTNASTGTIEWASLPVYTGEVE